MDSNKGYKILRKEGHKNIVAIKKSSDYYLEKHSHNFDVDLIIISGSLEITTCQLSVLLQAGSRFKLNKNEMHSEKAGENGVLFLSARP